MRYIHGNNVTLLCLFWVCVFDYYSKKQDDMVYIMSKTTFFTGHIVVVRSRAVLVGGSLKASRLEAAHAIFFRR